MRRHLWTAGLVAACAGVAATPARAQGAPEQPSWFARMMVDRLAEQLGLTPAQRDQISALIRDGEKKRREAEEAQQQEIRKLLTEQQQTQYDELRQNPGRTWGGGGGGWQPGNQDPMQSPQMKELAEKVGLAPEQQEKVAEVMRVAMEKGRKRGEEIFRQIREGTFDMTKIQDEFTKFFDETSKEVRTLLTAEQQPKFDTWWKDLREQMADPMRAGELMQRFSGGGGGGGGRGGRGEWGRRGGEEGPTLDRVLRDLSLTEDEKLVLAPAIEKILKLDTERRAARRDEGRRLRDLASGGAVETVREALDAARKAEADWRTARETAERELRDLVTLAQEAVLVSHGVLR